MKVGLTSGLDGGPAKEQHQVDRNEETFPRETVEKEERRRRAAARSAIGKGEIFRVRFILVALGKSEMGVEVGFLLGALAFLSFLDCFLLFRLFFFFFLESDRARERLRVFRERGGWGGRGMGMGIGVNN